MDRRAQQLQVAQVSTPSRRPDYDYSGPGCLGVLTILVVLVLLMAVIRFAAPPLGWALERFSEHVVEPWDAYWLER